MRVSLDWLRDFVECDYSPQELADRLTMGGLEVEGIEEVGSDCAGVVVGQIETIVSHPGADRLSLCRVRIPERDLSIVCGAANMKPGDKVALALPGARLPGGLTITAAEIKGQTSEGMMCSAAELGLGPDADGIMILSPDADLGVPLSRVLSVKDWILEVSVTPNRGDCLSMIGVAREVSALTGARFRVVPRSLHDNGEPMEGAVRVQIKDPDLCPRYTARLIRGVTIGPSPLWLRMRLERAGMRPINNVVDVTNYVMLEYGQPLHAFDFRRLEGGTVRVKRADSGETFVTLDGMPRTMPGDTVMICDGIRSVAIGGIMGGMNSEIEEDTRDVLLESAYFSPKGIRRSSKSLGLQTESAYRFERGVDIDGVVSASERAAALIAEFAGGVVAKGMIDAYPVPVRRPQIHLRRSRINTLLGVTIQDIEIEGILRRLGMEAEPESSDVWRVTPASYRSDVTGEIDLVEEIGRVKGYNDIPAVTPKVWMLPVRPGKESFLEYKTKEVLRGFGFCEIITYSFISPQALHALRLPEHDERLRPLVLLNPLSEDQSVMRTTLVPGLLETARYNISFENRDMKLFELREVFMPTGDGYLPEERRVLAGLAMGVFTGGSWDYPSRRVSFHDVKGCVESLLHELRIADVTFSSANDRVPYMHPGKSALIQVDGSDVGALGELHPEAAGSFDLPEGVHLFEIELPALVSSFDPEARFSSLPRFPSIIRDVAVVVDEMVTAGEITGVIRGVSTDLMEDVQIFDCYRGDPIPEGRKGLAFRVRYRSSERTLTDAEVNNVHQDVLERLKTIRGLTIR